MWFFFLYFGIVLGNQSVVYGDIKHNRIYVLYVHVHVCVYSTYVKWEISFMSFDSNNMEGKTPVPIFTVWQTELSSEKKSG